LGGADFPNDHLLEAARAFDAATGEDRLQRAERLVQASFTVLAPTLLKQIDVYFKGKIYNPEIDLKTQNSSTPLEFAALAAYVHRSGTLTPSSQKQLDDIMAKGCCKPKLKNLRYWGGKAGSGWRILTLTGYLERDDGRQVAYSYFNAESNKTDSLAIEAQIPVALEYIAQNITLLMKSPKP
jgi:beta-lactamase class A